MLIRPSIFQKNPESLACKETGSRPEVTRPEHATELESWKRKLKEELRHREVNTIPLSKLKISAHRELKSSAHKELKSSAYGASRCCAFLGHDPLPVSHKQRLHLLANQLVWNQRPVSRHRVNPIFLKIFLLSWLCARCSMQCDDNQ